MGRFPRRILFLLSLSLSASLVSAPLGAQAAPRPFLFKDARGEVAAAMARGDADVLLVVASREGRNADVARAVERAGGTIHFREDAVDYLRARVPVARAEELAAHPGVLSAEVSITGMSRTFGLVGGRSAGPAPEATPVTDEAREGGPAEVPGPAADTTWPPIPSDRPLAERYSPYADIGLLELREAHPTFDGRGVTIAMIDLSPDPLLPELQVATTLDGRRVPKIAWYGTATDLEGEDDGRWLKMEQEVVASGGTVTIGDSAYTAPRDGTFRADLLDEEVFDTLSDSGIDKDLNRDENPEGSSRLFGVLWDPASGDVWVDTDQDRSFADEQALADYRVRPGFGVFGTDDPDTPVRESVGFAVQLDEEKGRVGLNIGVASHASLVVGAALGSRGDHGRFDGVAPGARLASVAEGGSAYGQTEAAIIAARDAEADVIYFEQSSLITRNYLLRDGRLVPTVIYERILEEYGVSIVSPTHNYPILGASDDFVVGRGVIGIGGHESADNFFANHGIRVEHHDNLLITGGYGPMGNGALEPDVISPSNYVSTSRGFVEGGSVPGLFQLPPGYTIAGGTSTATPTAAGAVAVLISAARQEGLRHDPMRVHHAITRSARWVPHIAAYKQGNGVVNVAGALALLRALDDVPDALVDGPGIEVRAPVRHAYSHLLPEPHFGVGLFEREGWRPGERGERTVTFTRTRGPREPMTFRLSWAGNEDGTFSAPASVELPLDTPVDVPIGVAPASAGVHTAHLTLEHPDVPGFAHRMHAAVVAAEPLTADDGFEVERKVEVPRPGITSLFYDVPEGAQALRVELHQPERGVSLSVSRPDTRQTASIRGAPADTGRAVRIVRDPTPGVWEVRLDDVADTRTFDWKQAPKSEPLKPTPATVKVSTIAVDATAADSGGVAEQLSFTNRMAGFKGAAESLPFGSARRERPTIREKELQVYEVDVPPGSALLLARASRASDPGADLDVYVFDCTGEECKGAGADGDERGDEVVLVENPAAGAWKVVVDGFSVPSGGTSYDYVDVVFSTAFGSVGVLDEAEQHDTGTTWTAEARLFGPAFLEEGRTPFAGVLLRSGGTTVDVIEVPLAASSAATEEGGR